MPQTQRFVIEGGGLVVADPAYSLDDGLFLENCVNGGWTAVVQSSGANGIDLNNSVIKKVWLKSSGPYEVISLVTVDSEITGSHGLIGVYDLGDVGENESTFGRIYWRLSTGSRALMDLDKELSDVDGGVVFYWDGAIRCLLGRDKESRIVQVEIECY